LQVQHDFTFVLDASTLQGGLGAIVFDGKETSLRKRTFWVLENAGEMRFILENNNLTPDSRVSISGFWTTPELRHVYKEELNMK